MPAQKRKVAEIVDPGSIAQAKRKATKNKKVPIRKASSPESTDSDDNGSAYPSKPIHPISSYNGLDTLPLGMKWQINRRWYFYDIVEPAPRFRPTPNRYKGKKKKPAEVSEGDDSDALSDHSGDEKLPVSWSCYLRKYVVKVPWKKPELDATLFEYGEEDVVEIEVNPIVRSARPPEHKKDPNDPKMWRLGFTTTYKIHAGYSRVLLGFDRELDFVLDDKMKMEELQFRSLYLMRVLDAFVEELEKRTINDPAKFRSRVLNPIIQRQLRGVSDNNADEVKRVVGIKPEDAMKFYLAQDPLDPKFIVAVLKNILHITPVRISMAVFGSGLQKHGYESAKGNTEIIGIARSTSQENDDKGPLLPDELELIRREGLQNVYKNLIEASATPNILSTGDEEGNAAADGREGNGVPTLTTKENNLPVPPLENEALEDPQKHKVGKHLVRLTTVADSQVGGKQLGESTAGEQTPEASKANQPTVEDSQVGEKQLEALTADEQMAEASDADQPTVEAHTADEQTVEPPVSEEETRMDL